MSKFWQQTNRAYVYTVLYVHFYTNCIICGLGICFIKILMKPEGSEQGRDWQKVCVIYLLDTIVMASTNISNGSLKCCTYIRTYLLFCQICLVLIYYYYYYFIIRVLDHHFCRNNIEYKFTLIKY